MDVRQLALLARQPSIALISREHFLGLPKRGVAFLLANVMFWQPMWAQADGIVVSAPGTTLDHAGNGVPIVNIATPNASGLSHNKFHDYNVGTNGIILNNAATQTVATQLGANIVGNPHLKASGSAQTILNEVNGGSPSQLRGYTEVAGQSARVIVANPYGISCNGCGFINTPRVTLTTGKPIVDGGRLERFQVDQGSVSIDGAGLNATNVERFEIITRSAKINAEIQAKNLTLVAGRNDVDAHTLNATARANDSSAKPELAIDSSVLGGMYAGAIRLVGTEAGVGVKLDGKLIASGGDIQLDANGHLRMADTSASGAVNIAANSLEAQGPVYGTALNVNTQGALTNQKTLAARDSITLSSGGQLTNNGVIEAGVNADTSRNASGDVSLGAQNLSNRNSVIASRNLTVNTAQTLDNQGGTLNAQQSLNLTVATLDNQNKGRVLSAGGLAINANQLLNSQGQITSNGALNATLGHLNNTRGELNSLTTATLRVASLDNVAGLISAGERLDINASGALNNQSGRLAAARQITLGAASLDNSQQGSIVSQGTLDVTVSGKLANQQQGKIEANGAARLTVGSLDNQQGASLTSSNTLNLTAGQVNNSEGGKIASAQTLTASVTGLDQHDKGQLYSNTDLSLDLNHGQLNNQNALINAPGQLVLKNLNGVANQGGEISSLHAFTLAAISLDNSAGKVLSQQALTLRITQDLNNHNGRISALGVDAQVGSLNNTDGTLSSDADLTLRADGVVTNTDGEISSAANTRLTAASLVNRNAEVLGDKALNIDLTGALDNRNGVLGSGKQVDINAASLDNRDAGSLVSDGSLTARITGLLDNQHEGELLAKGLIDLSTGSLDNRGGRVTGQDLLTLRSDSADNRGGLMRADKDLKLAIGQLDNRDKGVINGKAAIDLKGTGFDNRGGLLTGVGPLTLQAKEVQNALGRIASQSDLTASIDTLRQQGGALVAQGNLSLTGSHLDNRDSGLVGTTKALTLNVGEIDNRAGELSASEGVSVTGQRLDNSEGGKLLAGADLSLQVARLINQNKGLIQAKGNTTLTGSRLDNAQGTLDSLKGLDITLDDALDNGKGLISSEGRLNVNVGSLDNTGGNLGSADNLALTSRGAVLNQGGSISTDGTLTLNSASLDNSQKGQVSGKGATQVTTALVDNSQGGHLISGSTLALTATQVNNAKGRIASDQALTAKVTGLDQQGGELFSKTSLSLDLNHGQLNNQGGLINAPGALLLKNLNGVNNQKGEISSQQAFTVAAREFDNSGGKLLSNQGLTLRIAQALNNIKGLVSAASVDSRSQMLDNSDGLLSSRGRLDLLVDSTLTNQRGSVIADGALLLTADTLDNHSGEIAGKADVTATLKQLDNQQGKLISTETLSLSANSVDNRQSGLLGSSKALNLNVGALDNRGGELTTNTDLTLVGNSLDNSDGGQVFAGKALSLTLDQLLNRNKGLIDARTILGVDARRLDNSGGNLVSLQGTRLNLTGAFDNRAGKVSSEGALSVKTTELNNTKGSLSSAGNLTLASDGRLDNQGGELLTDGALKLDSASLDNREQGSISGKGPVTVSTGAFDNSQNGRLNSGSTLNLNAGQVTNQEGGRIGSVGALTAKVSGLDQQGGKLFSNSTLSLDLNHGQLNNQDGLINAPGSLLLTNLKGVDNQGGEISSAQAFTLLAQSLNNTRGKLLSNQGLTLRVAELLDNTQGMIGATHLDVHADNLNNNGGTLTSSGDLELQVDRQLNNQDQGLIRATHNLTLNTVLLNNQNSSLLAGNAMTLNAMAIGNNAKGLINSQGDLSITSDRLNSNDGGEVSAKGDISLNLKAFLQEGGRLLGDKAVTLNLADGDFDNRKGVLNTKGPLTFNNLRDLNNRGGEISSDQGFTLNGRTLDNNGGNLISRQQLSLNGAELTNLGGLMSGWEGLNVTGASLDNRFSGTLSSRNGNLGVSLSGNLLNNDNGALVSQGNLSVTGQFLDNGNKGIISSGGGQKLDLSTSINNSQEGLIDSGAGLVINTNTLANSNATINAQQAITLNAGDLYNSLGKLAGNGALTVNLKGVLENSDGKLASAGPLLVKDATEIQNQRGQIVSQDQLTLLTGELDNSNGGTIAAKETLRVNATGTLNNAGTGLIHSQNGDVQLRAANLANRNGAIQAQNAMLLAIAGEFDNQNGKIIAQTGDVSVSAANIDNRGGVLASLKGALEARAVGVLRNGYDLNNKGGILQGQRLNLQALGGFGNNGGRVSAQSGDAIIRTTDLDNRNGGLYAKGLVSVSGNAFDNSTGQVAAHRIDFSLGGALNNRSGILESDSTLAVRAASLDNQGGRLRALGGSGKTDFQIGGLLDNRNGILETGNSDLTLAVGGFLNAGGQLLHLGDGTFDIATANVTGAGGSIVTRGGLTLNADSWTNTSVIQAGRLYVNVNNFSQAAGGQLLASTRLEGRGGHWANEGLIASDGSMDVQLWGGYSGNGRVSSIGDLTFGAAQMTINEAGSVAGGGLTKVNVGGQLTNLGRLTSNSGLEVNAGVLNNFGTLASAQNMLINAQAMTNNRIRLNQGALLFSGGDMKFQVGTLNNTYSDIYSLGGISVLGYNGADRANRVDNLSGTIESTGDMSLKSAVVSNKMENFKVKTTAVSSAAIGVRCFNCDTARPKRLDRVNSHLVWQQTFDVAVDGDADASNIIAGKNLSVTGSEFANSNSTVSAAGNITINVDSFNNTGTALGGYSSLKYINATPSLEVWAQIMEYNRYNDAAYNKNLHFWNAGGQESMETPWTKSNPHVGEIWEQMMGTYILNTGQGGYMKFGESQYATGIRTQAPAVVLNATPFDEKIVAAAASRFVPAIVQAGGNVTITATSKITNGVERSFSPAATGAPRGADTRATASAKPTIINLNRQLPPDLAQQQVNPLALPGFSLPSGQNGLFRLSGQGTSSGGMTPATSGPQSWTLGGATVSPLQRQVDVPGIGGRTIEVAPVDLVVGTDRQLTQQARQGSGVDASASAINVGAPADVGSGVQLPGHNSATGSIAAKPAVSVAPSTSVPGSVPPVQTLTRVQGLPDSSVRSNPHKYLIETNPVLTDLKQFMSSDYLLGKLGYDPDKATKRLGDGFYEQRLIQQAVVERTGKRFIDGQTSNEDLFKHLMNNAIASKDSLNLSVGVTLSAQQVAALTHDIVWLEEHEVNGEKVLVPVLYLAQTNNRLAPNGALIEGTDVKLIAGEDLQNAGTLRASNNLTAAAGNNLVNSGLIEAGNRLDLLAGNDIVNKSGGIISGRDVYLVSVNGDIRNERTVTEGGFSNRGYTQSREYLDSASRIEASKELGFDAGRDFKNIGSVLTSGTDMRIEAGRDASIVAVEQHNADFNGTRSNSVVQGGSTVTSGRDFVVNAGRDVTVVASQIDARRNVEMSATQDLLISSGADESHSYYKSKKVTAQEDHIKQVGSSITAGGKAGFTSGNDLTVVSSRISAGDEAYLVAGDDLNVLAAEDYDYSLYDKKKKGSLGRKETRRDEVTKITHIGSSISSGGDLTLVSGGDQRYQVANLNAGKDLTISSGGDLTFESVTDLRQESHEKSKSSLAWNEAKGAGTTDETVRQSHLVAAGDMVIKAAGKIQIDVKEVNQQTVAQSIDAMVKADPQLAWLKDMQARGDIDWRMVKEVHDQFNYESSGMGMGAAIVVAVVVTVLTAGAASAWVGGMASATAGSGSAMAAAGVAGTATAGVSAGFANLALTAAITSMASTAAVSAINNKGNLGDVLKEVLSPENLKGYITSAVLAGAGSYTSDWGRTLTAEGNWVTTSVNDRLKAYAVNTALKGLLTGDDGAKSWLTIAGTGALGEFYEYSTGRGPDIRPGVDRAGGAEFTELLGGLVPREWIDGVLREGKNIGLNKVCEAMLAVCHGTLISDIANQVPGMNAFATLHDTWMNKVILNKLVEWKAAGSIGLKPDMTLFENLGTMPPALVVNYGALYDKFRPLIEQTKREARN
ncbi:filamentous hemagglutinin N-terminal domain-containing protein [Pseudomonas purpurea]|uniref:two-partner secretion domain-containing protein n=1 Tax=Pseudomonas purpurea TaxID=3136737 RepID=UPI003263A6B5